MGCWRVALFVILSLSWLSACTSSGGSSGPSHSSARPAWAQSNFNTPSSTYGGGQRLQPRDCRNTTEDMQNDYYALLYIASHGDLISRLGRDPQAARTHYAQFGCDEGRRITFDPLTYVAGYGDLIQTVGTNEQAALDHYLQHGYRERRSPQKFNHTAYLNQHGDLQGAIGNNKRRLVLHCIQHGFNERRQFCG